MRDTEEERYINLQKSNVKLFGQLNEEDEDEEKSLNSE